MSKFVFGLTGNMGCGKSEVARILRTFPGVVVFEADAIAKDILCSKNNIPKIRELLGDSIFSDGKVDKARVAKLVFNDRDALKRLEDFLHPATQQFIWDRVAENNTASLFFVEAALIFEGGLQNSFDGVIVVTCSKEEQFRRLREFRNFTDEEIKQRLSRQWPGVLKEEMADFLIDNSGTAEKLKEEVEALYKRLKGGI